MTFNAIVEQIKRIFGRDGWVAKFLPPRLICCTALKRPGLSVAVTFSQLLNENEKYGLPIGLNADGSENLMNKHDYALIKTVYDSLINNAVVQVGIPAGSLLIQVNGANAGGPIVATGTNLLDSVAYGIFAV